MRAKRSKKESPKMLYKIVVVAIFLIVIATIINIAPNYIVNNNTDKMAVIINNNDATESMKFEAFVNNDTIYMSTKDIANFFDQDIFYDNVYDQIITTSNTKVAALKLNEREMTVNGSKVKLSGAAVKANEEFYLPFSEMSDVYNVEVNYIEQTNILTIDSLDRKQEKGNASNEISVKYRPTGLSKTLDTVKKGDSVVIIEKRDDGWYKVRTNLGIIGYTKDVTNIHSTREDLEIKKQIEGKISMVWDAYYTDSAPERTETLDDAINVISPTVAELVRLGQGELNIKLENGGESYVQWAHNNNCKVWAMVSNGSQPQTTSEVLNDYELRQKLISNIVNMALQYNFDGINLDFENVNTEDKDMLSRLVIELAPRLREYGKVLSVDVTAPDGGTNWSESFDRHTIGRAADYIVFMAYDEYTEGSKEPGTTAGADWLELNVKKFVGTQEEVDNNKLILAIPFYTRIWAVDGDDFTTNVVLMKNIEANIPNGVEKQWKDDVKQYYIEYEQNGRIYKMWIEDKESLKAKIDILNEYNLAGAAYWEKDFETQDIWQMIRQELMK